MPTTYAIPNGRTVMNAVTYTGQGISTPTTISTGFPIDFVWVKKRSGAGENYVWDTVRGGGNTNDLVTNQTAAQGYNSAYISQSFSGNNVIVNDAGAGNELNASGGTFVAWNWNAGSGTTSSNTNGSTTSTVSVNTTAGFSIVSYTTPTATSAITLGHGLGVTPAMIITKERGNTSSWAVYHQSLGNTGCLYLSSTAAFGVNNSYGTTSPTNSVFTLGSIGSYWDASTTFISYCWAPIAGFSQFGSYTGNGSADGPFIYTGFRPKFVLFRITSSTGNWDMLDTSRNPYNLTNYRLFAESSSAELTGAGVDILSNGFKIRNTDTSYNSSGANYIYAAFAENPFKYANAR